MKPSSETIYRVLIPVWAANIKISGRHTAVMLYSGILFYKLLKFRKSIGKYIKPLELYCSNI